MPRAGSVPPRRRSSVRWWTGGWADHRHRPHPATALDLVRPLGLHLPAVMMSGALVYDLGTGRPLATRSLSAESRSALLALLDRAGRDALVYRVLTAGWWCFTAPPSAITPAASSPSAAARRISSSCRWNTMGGSRWRPAAF